MGQELVRGDTSQCLGDLFAGLAFKLKLDMEWEPTKPCIAKVPPGWCLSLKGQLFIGVHGAGGGEPSIFCVHHNPVCRHVRVDYSHSSDEELES